jgi:hypothetical protein
MSIARITLAELASLINVGLAHEELSVTNGVAVAIVDHVGADDASVHAVADRIGMLPCVLVAETPASTPGAIDDHPLAPLADVIAGRDELATIVEHVNAAPLAAVTLATLLRLSTAATIEQGLMNESVSYSMLQSGPEFARWRSARAQRDRAAASTPAVLVERDGATMHVALNRPEVHNALDTNVRDGLAEALTTAVVDETIERIVLRGNGPSFCSGGDLDTFGTFPDPVTAHAVRLTRSPARLMAQLADRVDVHVHGTCLGAGVELPAFAHRVLAHPDTTFGLPEIGLGLIPGAGGTVSLPRRIGRHRTVLLALTMQRIDAPTALRWGLVDAITKR